VQYYAVVMWVDEVAFLDAPAIVCRAWHPSEERDPEQAVLEVLLELHDRGLVRCECFSRYAPEGDIGHGWVGANPAAEPERRLIAQRPERSFLERGCIRVESGPKVDPGCPPD
jgi:hypothetical protein